MEIIRFPALFLVIAIGISFFPAASGWESASAARYEKTLLRLHNRERKRRDLPRFRFTGSLRRAAKNYAKVMRQNDHFSHTGPDGSSSGDRIRAAGFTGNATGENIAFGYRSPKTVFRGWMKSPGHRRNIRRRYFDQIGFGKSGTYWVTNFGG
ncbi:MAG: hypothetical protein CMO55_26790 [Verrucomicrobiales bacterium]|nr:hypothetical protein [Verrucomicrobiales bacterium]